jgi:hypothetical protein
MQTLDLIGLFALEVSGALMSIRHDFDVVGRWSHRRNRTRRPATRAAVNWTGPAAAASPTATPAQITDPRRP